MSVRICEDGVVLVVPAPVLQRHTMNGAIHTEGQCVLEGRHETHPVPLTPVQTVLFLDAEFIAAWCR